MRALQFTEYGGPEVLTWEDASVPHAGPGQIRIAVRAASVNPADWKLLAGAMSGGQPLVGMGYLGYDAAGVVDEVGEGVTGVSEGDDVFGRGQNTQAEYAVLDAWAAKPPSIDWAVAAAAGVAGETSERGLRLLGVKAGDTIFVDGGAGGVGAVAVQMAVVRGARVIASASEANQDHLREIRAIPVLYGEGVDGRVRSAAGGRVVINGQVRGGSNVVIFGASQGGHAALFARQLARGGQRGGRLALHDRYRVLVVEVMGRYAGWIAIYAGVAGGAPALWRSGLPAVRRQPNHAPRGFATPAGGAGFARPS